MDESLFVARKNMIEKVLKGEPCIEAYTAVYGQEDFAMVGKYDPLSREISARSMCEEIVNEINTLLDESHSNLVNATRYSYFVSLQVDLETQQIDSYASCISSEAEADPAGICVEIMTEPGYFDLYNAEDKSDVCQQAATAWQDKKTLALVNGEAKPDICAILTSDIFQTYNYFIQDLSDGIIGQLTEELSEQIKLASEDFEKTRDIEAVQQFLMMQSDL